MSRGTRRCCRGYRRQDGGARFLLAHGCVLEFTKRSKQGKLERVEHFVDKDEESSHREYSPDGFPVGRFAAGVGAFRDREKFIEKGADLGRRSQTNGSGITNALDGARLTGGDARRIAIWLMENARMRITALARDIPPAIGGCGRTGT